MKTGVLKMVQFIYLETLVIDWENIVVKNLKLTTRLYNIYIPKKEIDFFEFLTAYNVLTENQSTDPKTI